MKRYILLLFAMLLTSVVAYGQASNDTIKIQKDGNQFYRRGKILRPRKMLEIMQHNPEAFDEMTKAKANYDGANILGGIGGFLIGWSLGTVAVGGNPEWKFFGAGIVFIVLSTPCIGGYYKHSQHAVELYNSKLKTSENGNIKIDFGLTSNGLGLIYRF